MPEKRKSLYDRIFKKITVKEEFGRYVVAETAISYKNFCKMGDFRRRRYKGKVKCFFEKLGIENFIPEEKLACCFENEADRSFCIPKERIFDCFVFAVSKTKAKIKNLIIADKKLKATDYEKIIEVCGYAGMITLCTDEVYGARELSDRMMYEYGMCMNVAPVKTEFGYAVINVDEGYVRIGDFVIDGAEFLNDSNQYNVDMPCVAGILGEENNLEIKNWLSGKNIIKIS